MQKVIKNDINSFMHDSNLNLIQLLSLVSLKNKQKISKFFPVNGLSAVYYLIIYTICDEDLALKALSQIKDAFNWVNSIDEAIEIEGDFFDISKFRNHDSKNKLTNDLPTTFLASAMERLISQSVPMLVTQTNSYRYKIANNIPFSSDDIINYLQIKSADSFLYGAIIESIIPEYISDIQIFLYKIWQMNDFVDDCIDYEDDLKNNQPNVLRMIESLHVREVKVYDYAKQFLISLKEDILKHNLPQEFFYLSELPEVFRQVGFFVIDQKSSQTI